MGVRSGAPLPTRGEELSGSRSGGSWDHVTLPQKRAERGKAAFAGTLMLPELSPLSVLHFHLSSVTPACPIRQG